MRNRKFLPILVLSLAGLAWPLSIAALQPGVLKAQASVKPERIMLEGKAQITIATVDGFQQPIPVASIKITTDTGYFEASNQNTVFGFTDKEGVFQAIWHANQRTKPGNQQFEVTAGKNGYVSKYPLTATAKVVVQDPSKPRVMNDDSQDNSNRTPSDPFGQDR